MDEDEAAIALAAASHGPKDPDGVNDELTRRQAWCLYLSHFLSMWNSRAYEYAGVLFVQATFPGTLLPSSLIGISETICILVAATAVGRWIDESPTRLRPLLLSIIANRVTLIACCALWLAVFFFEQDLVKRVLFAGILLLGMVEKTSRTSNMLSTERDWLPTLASYPVAGENIVAKDLYNLTHLNTVIRRIDIICKFVAPLVMTGAMVVIQPAIVASLTAGISSISLGVEIWSILQVWQSNVRIRAPKEGIMKETQRPVLALHQLSIIEQAIRFIYAFWDILHMQIEGLRYYFSTTVWAPSFSVAILHASVLEWTGTLITWLLNSGFSYSEVTVGKGVGAVFEVGSTFIFSWMVSILVSRYASTASSDPVYQMVESQGSRTDEEDDNDIGRIANGAQEQMVVDDAFQQHRSTLEPIAQAGLYSIISLLLNLVPALIALFFLDAAVNRQSTSDSAISPLYQSTAATLVFLAFLSLSFVGRWTYDLSVTQLTQTLVPVSHRSEFGGTEQALFALAQFTHWVASAIWYEQNDYKWLAVGSLSAVAIATGLYWWWFRWWTTHSTSHDKVMRR